MGGQTPIDGTFQKQQKTKGHGKVPDLGACEALRVALLRNYFLRKSEELSTAPLRRILGILPGIFQVFLMSLYGILSGVSETLRGIPEDGN